MKRTQLSDLFATIRASAISFVSIVVFLALGVGIYVGFHWSGCALQQTLHERMEAGALYDLALYYPFGIEEEDLEALAAIDGVDAVEPQRIGYAFFDDGKQGAQAKLVSLPRTMNAFIGIEGELPQRNNEIAVERGSANTLGLAIGDTVTLKQQGAQDARLLTEIKNNPALTFAEVCECMGQEASYLHSETLIVTAIVESPEYLSISPSSYGVSPLSGLAANTVFFVRESAFCEETAPRISGVLLRSDKLRGKSTFSAEYDAAAEAFYAAVAPTAEAIGEKSYGALKENSDRILAELQANTSRSGRMLARYWETTAEKLVRCESTLSLRRNNTGYIYGDMIAEIVIKLRYTLGGVFLLLGLLVSGCAMTRLIGDGRREIGVKKANGFRQREITALYLSYNGLAGLLGIFAGLALAYFAVEPLLTPYLDGTFTSTCKNDYASPSALWLLAAVEALLLLVTYLSCRRVLHCSAAELLRGEDRHPRALAERKGRWSRLPVFTQAIFSNTLGERRRVAATLVGIAGCTALLVSAFMLRDDVLKSFHRQYEQYYHFDCIVYFDNQVSAAKEELEKLFRARSIPCTSVYCTDGYSYCEGCPKKLTALIVFEEAESFSALVQPESADRKSPYEYEGMWLPESLQRYYGLDSHVTATYENFAGSRASAALGGFYKAYSHNLTCYMDRKTYSTVFGESYQANAFLVDASATDFATLQEALAGIDGYTQTYEYYRSDREDAAVFEIIARAMVGIYFTASVLMSAFVTLHLLEAFLEEKRREITILLANGYSGRQGRRYVSLDTGVLTVLGIAAGLAAGLLLGSLSIASFESEYIRLLHEPDALACLIGAVTAAVLTLGVGAAAFAHIKDFCVSDLNT